MLYFKKMLIKNSFLFIRRLNFCEKRLFQVRCLSEGSYLHNHGNEPLTYATIGDVIYNTTQKYPDRIAIRSVHEDLTLTYEQLLTQADALGYALRAQGLEKGDRIGIWSHNTAAFLVAIIAAARVGLMTVMLNPVYEKPELSYCIKKTGMKGLFIGEKIENRDYYNTLNHLIPELQNCKPGSVTSQEFPTLTSVISTEKEKLNGVLHYDSLVDEFSHKDVSKYSKEVKPDDGGLIHMTSGTTGNPKAALVSHFSVVNNAYYIGKRNSYHEDAHRICVQVPLFHVLGSIITTLGGFSHGCTLVLAAPKYNITSNVNALFSEKCTIVTGTPTMYVDLVYQVRERGIKPPKLQIAMSGGAPCSPQLIRQINGYLKAPSVKCLYGLTETTASAFQSIPNDTLEQVSETVGYLQDHTEVKVVDEEGNVVPFDSPGELMVRGYLNMMYYWDDPEKTKETLRDDGWLYTGDKFILTKDGYGQIVGRIKDIIIRGGENIAPKEVEDVLNIHPDIIETQVIGVADERLGEELCAVIRLRSGTTLTLDDIVKHCTGRLTKFKIPRILKYTDEFPKTASGKIQKFKIKELVESGKL